MRVVITKNYDEMSRWAAHFVANKILEANPTEEKPFKLGCPTGSSPLGMYKELIRGTTSSITSTSRRKTFISSTEMLLTFSQNVLTMSR